MLMDVTLESVIKMDYTVVSERVNDNINHYRKYGDVMNPVVKFGLYDEKIISIHRNIMKKYHKVKRLETKVEE